jgi:GntR family transcriptional regulator
MTEHLAKTYQRSRVPLYLQVAAILRKRIEDGHWALGEKISTLEELENEFQVARVTVRQAIELLQEEGLVDRRQGKGTFVARDVKGKRWLRLETDWDALIRTIEDNVPHSLPVEAPVPPPRLEAGDGILADTYQYLRSVQSRGEEPYALVGVHLAKHVYAKASDAFKTSVALSVLSDLEGVAIARAHQTLVIGSADTEAAHFLKIALNAPTAEVHCVAVDDKGVAIYIGEIIYRGDFIKLDIDLLANGMVSR